MLVKTVKITDKGQITLPAETLRAMNLRRGSELLLVQEGDRIVLVRASKIGNQVMEEFRGWENLSAPAFAKLWDNEADEVWNDFRG